MKNKLNAYCNEKGKYTNMAMQRIMLNCEMPYPDIRVLFLLDIGCTSENVQMILPENSYNADIILQACLVLSK